MSTFVQTSDPGVFVTSGPILTDSLAQALVITQHDTFQITSIQLNCGGCDGDEGLPQLELQKYRVNDTTYTGQVIRIVR